MCPSPWSWRWRGSATWQSKHWLKTRRPYWWVEASGPPPALQAPPAQVSRNMGHTSQITESLYYGTHVNIKPDDQVTVTKDTDISDELLWSRQSSSSYPQGISANSHMFHHNNDCTTCDFTLYKTVLTKLTNCPFRGEHNNHSVCFHSHFCLCVCPCLLTSGCCHVFWCLCWNCTSKWMTYREKICSFCL